MAFPEPFPIEFAGGSTPYTEVEVAFADDWNAAAPTWTDVTGTLLAWDVSRGRQHELDRMETGTARVVLNNKAGDYWPDNAGGAYAGQVVPGLRVRISTTYQSTVYQVFTGFIERWDHGFRLPGGGAATVQITASDGLKLLNSLLLNNAGEAEEASGTRVGNVLDELGWPAADRDLNTGESSVIATGAQENVNALAHLELVQLSELGTLFVAGDNTMTYRSRHALLKAPLTTSQATYGDDAAELDFSDPLFRHDETLVYNDVRTTREGGTEQTVSDATSQAAFGKRTLARTGLLMTTDNEAQDQADYLLARFKDTAFRLHRMSIRPDRDAADLYPDVLGFELGTRITVNLDDLSLDEDFHIEGISHGKGPGAPWETIWTLTPASNLAYWALGVAGVSELGTTTRLAY